MSQTNLPPYDHWQAAKVQELKKLLSFDWILAGGLALQAFVGQGYRDHSDSDVIVKRTDQDKIAKSFDLTRIFIAERSGELSPFDPGLYYQKPIQDIWILNIDRKSWMLQVMLVDEVDGNWVFKRNEMVQMPWSDIYLELNGLKVLKPEIQLLYKSHDFTEKNKLDFEMVYPRLSSEARGWLDFNLKI